MKYAPTHLPLRRAIVLPFAFGLLLAASATASASASPTTSGSLPEDQKDQAGEEPIIVEGKKPERSPYRLPEQPGGFDPEGTVESVLRERARWMEGGESGIGSCSNIGPGGMTGCDLKVIKRAYEQGKKVGIGSGRASVSIGVGKARIGTGSE